uniref:Lipoprotein n=1 Tax=Ascaris lumbricoides TaxID=6252 RepID=A0A0M3HRY2_ASCLU
MKRGARTLVIKFEQNDTVTYLDNNEMQVRLRFTAGRLEDSTALHYQFCRARSIRGQGKKCPQRNVVSKQPGMAHLNDNQQRIRYGADGRLASVTSKQAFMQPE